MRLNETVGVFLSVEVPSIQSSDSSMTVSSSSSVSVRGFFAGFSVSVSVCVTSSSSSFVSSSSSLLSTFFFKYGSLLSVDQSR